MFTNGKFFLVFCSIFSLSHCAYYCACLLALVKDSHDITMLVFWGIVRTLLLHAIKTLHDIKTLLLYLMLSGYLLGHYCWVSYILAEHHIQYIDIGHIVSHSSRGGGATFC